MPDTLSVDAQRRFGGVTRLYGADSFGRLAKAHVAIAGIGGVGSWCAEALARSGVGAITLIDMDHVSESNINRQLHALTGTLGQSKVLAMAQRITGINPDCRLSLQDDFVSTENVHDLLAPDLSLLIDCTDQVSAKVAMVLEARARTLPLVVCGGAGGKTRPSSLRTGDLASAANDALLARLRNDLRHRHGYPKASDQAGKPRRRIPKMGVRALWFDQSTRLPSLWTTKAESAPAGALQGLACSGYGSVATITATMGMAAAAEAMEWLLAGRFPSA